ncbi:MAG: DNA-binding protein [Deltaproteobacteria bacterium]|nr:DNA-binding protein [Deltaproteobacteria bacterium]
MERVDGKIRKLALTPAEVAFSYGCNIGTLANQRAKKVGPKYFKVGKKVLYFRDDLERYFRTSPVETMDSIS